MNDSKTFKFNWKIDFKVTATKKSDDSWNISEFFQSSNHKKVIYQVWVRLHETEPENLDVMILKIGSLNPNRADIGVKVTSPKGLPKQLKITMLNWDMYTDILTFNKSSCPFGTIITYGIRHHDYSDFKAEDDKMLNTAMETKYMSNYHLSPELSDVRIKIENGEISAHKLVLVSHSPVFATIFSTNMKENKENCVRFEELDADVIKEMVKFMYTGSIISDTDLDVLLLLFSYAHMYQMEKLKIYCEYQLIHILGNNNVIEIAVLIDGFEMPKLKERIMDYLIFHKSQISFSKIIKEVNKSEVLRKFFQNETRMKELDSLF